MAIYPARGSEPWDITLRAYLDAHEADTSAHGATGAVVGTTDAQTLTNKTLGATNTLNGFTPQRLMEADAAGRVVSGSKTIPTGAVVGTTDAQTLTNKTLTAPVINNPTGDVGAGTFRDSVLAAVVASIGAAWTAYGSGASWTATTTNPTLGNGTWEAAYTQVGKTVRFRITLTMGSTTTFGSGVYTFALPVAAKAGQAIGATRLFDTSGSSNQDGSAYIEPSALSLCRVVHSTGSVLNSSPWTWATGDVIMIQGTYEAA